MRHGRLNGFQVWSPGLQTSKDRSSRDSDRCGFVVREMVAIWDQWNPSEMKRFPLLPSS